MSRLARTKKQAQQYLSETINKIAKEAPLRKSTSDDERRAQEIIQNIFSQQGILTAMEEFTFNDSLYKNVALHTGLAVLGTGISGLFPLGGLALHLLAAKSYKDDSTRKRYLLRRLFKFRKSQNLIATIPAEHDPKLRIVFLAHADAAFTGLLFHPTIVKFTAPEEPDKQPDFLKRPVRTLHASFYILAAIDLLRTFLGPLTWPLIPIEFLISSPSFLAFLLNLQIVVKNQVVPGANDNLSGIAAIPLLADRLIPHKPEDVELIFAITGCEEASLGGADALAKSKLGIWDPKNTLVISVDSLSNGDLHYVNGEGEIQFTPTPRWITDIIDQTNKESSHIDNVLPINNPVGGTDAGAFVAHGFDSVCFTCADSDIGSAHHYHLPTDTVENLDFSQILKSLDFIEAFTKNAINQKLPQSKILKKHQQRPRKNSLA